MNGLSHGVDYSVKVKRQRAELRQLTLDLTQAEHHERQRIAARLHDDLQQILVATRMRLTATLNSDRPNRSAVEDTERLIDKRIVNFLSGRCRCVGWFTTPSESCCSMS